MCVAGKKMLYRYCAERGVAHRNIGKAIVATRLMTHTQVLDDDTSILTGVSPREFADGSARAEFSDERF